MSQTPRTCCAALPLIATYSTVGLVYCITTAILTVRPTYSDLNTIGTELSQLVVILLATIIQL